MAPLIVATGANVEVTIAIGLGVGVTFPTFILKMTGIFENKSGDLFGDNAIKNEYIPNIQKMTKIIFIGVLIMI